MLMTIGTSAKSKKAMTVAFIGFVGTIQHPLTCLILHWVFLYPATPIGAVCCVTAGAYTALFGMLLIDSIAYFPAALGHAIVATENRSLN